jgi:hypothetical protein
MRPNDTYKKQERPMKMNPRAQEAKEKFLQEARKSLKKRIGRPKPRVAIIAHEEGVESAVAALFSKEAQKSEPRTTPLTSRRTESRTLQERILEVVQKLTAKAVKTPPGIRPPKKAAKKPEKKPTRTS